MAGYVGFGAKESMGSDSGGVAERILDAAIGILREAGIRRLTQLEVAEAAGIRQSHLTYYFPKRQDLLEAVTMRVVDGIADGVRGAVVDAGAAAADARAVLERLSASVSDIGHMRMFVGVIVEADRDPALRRIAVRATRRMEAVLANALTGDDADDAKERARRLLAAIWGLGLYHFLVRPRSRADPQRAYLSWLADAMVASSNPRSQP